MSEFESFSNESCHESKKVRASRIITFGVAAGAYLWGAGPLGSLMYVTEM